MSEVLKPCPFCGGEVIVTELPAHTHTRGTRTFIPDHPGSCSIECQKCEAGILRDDRDTAEVVWNTRHDPSAELLRECAKAMRRAASQFDYLLDEFDDDVAGLSGPHSLSTSEVATRTNELRAALARLKEAGVE